MSRGPVPARSARYQGRCTARKARASFSRSGPWRRRPSPSRRSRPGFRPARRSSFWERTCGCRRFGCARFRRPRRPGAPESRFSAVKGPPCRYRLRPSRTATMRPQQPTAGARARENWPFPRIRNGDGTPRRSPAATWNTRHRRPEPCFEGRQGWGPDSAWMLGRGALNQPIAEESVARMRVPCLTRPHARRLMPGSQRLSRMAAMGHRPRSGKTGRWATRNALLTGLSRNPCSCTTNHRSCAEPDRSVFGRRTR